MIAPGSNDALAIAIEMERVGNEFYTALSLASRSAAVRRFCALAARQEAEHLVTFTQLRQQQGVTTPPAPAEARPGPVASAKARIQPDRDTVRQVAESSNLADALAMAIDMERGAVSYYQSLLPQMPSAAKDIRRIISEEMTHVSALQALVAECVPRP